jgi:anti-sigma regulatory factor (Ser/Thr protein kinase)
MDGTTERAHSERERSLELRRRSELLSRQLVDSLRQLGWRTRRPFGESGDTFSLRLARVAPAVALLRDSLSRWLERRGVDREVVYDIALASSEACANAVEHPIGAVDQAFVVEARHRGDEVEIVVRDSGRWRSGPDDETRGRGMAIIRSVMSEVEVVQQDNGTTLVMRRRL